MVSRCEFAAFAALAIVAMSVGRVAAYTVDGPRRPNPWEITAVYELEDCLKKLSSDATIRIDGVEACFHVGDTEFTRKQGISAATFEDEQWVVKCFGSDVVLVGGGTRGTLYAVYHFLEDVCGVRWWGDDDEDVPQAGKLELKSFDLKGRPHFRCRQIYRKGKTSFRTAARCRLNGNGDYAIPPAWGAGCDMDSGDRTDARLSSNVVVGVIKSIELPIPGEYAIAERVRACAERGEMGVMIEHGDSGRSDMYELKFYIARKTLEDPSLDADDLLRDFYLRYYGPAAGKIRRVRERLRQPFEDLSFAERLFDEAELAAKGNPKLERRVKRARMDLDFIRKFPRCVGK